MLAKHNTYSWISNEVSKLPSMAMLAPMRVTDTNINFIQFRPKPLCKHYWGTHATVAIWKTPLYIQICGFNSRLSINHGSLLNTCMALRRSSGAASTLNCFSGRDIYICFGGSVFMLLAFKLGFRGIKAASTLQCFLDKYQYLYPFWGCIHMKRALKLIL